MTINQLRTVNDIDLTRVAAMITPITPPITNPKIPRVEKRLLLTKLKLVNGINNAHESIMIGNAAIGLSPSM